MIRLPSSEHSGRRLWAALIFPFFLFAEGIYAQPEPDYLSLKTIAGRLGMQARWVEKDQSVRLQSEWTQLDFTVHRRECELNGIRLHLGFPIRSANRFLEISKADWEYLLQPILTPGTSGSPIRIQHIVLDPGHGGKDQGAHNAAIGLIEKSLTLDLAVRLKRKLVQDGYVVSMTREDDRFIPLEKRAAYANAASADLFLSLHFNAAGKASVAGLETFVFTPPFQPSTSRSELHSTDKKTYPGNTHNASSTLLGFYVQRAMASTLPSPDRGLKRARFTVLRDISIPGLLIEGGFLSNDHEGRNVGSAAYREQLCDAIIEALRTYRRTTERIATSKP